MANQKMNKEGKLIKALLLYQYQMLWL